MPKPKAGFQRALNSIDVTFVGGIVGQAFTQQRFRENVLELRDDIVGALNVDIERSPSVVMPEN